jgi:hypothetical protein
MLWFIDETWQNVGDRRVGALGAIAIRESAYNPFCREVYAIKASKLGATEFTDSEFKAQNCFAKSAFKRHSLHEDSYWISATDEFFSALAKYRVRCFVIWTTNPSLLDLRNPNSTSLSKPYKQLLFDMGACMRLEAPDELGSIVFDERGLKEDEATARAIQNYLIRTSYAGSHRWDRYFLTIPSFAASTINPGLQAADLIAYLGAHRCDARIRPELDRYQTKLDELRYEFRSGRRQVVRRCIRKVN